MSRVLAKFDLAVIGGGIVGLATARQLVIKHPNLKVCVIEKETDLAMHQSSRNSGVVHCGIYYKKGSLKSRFCIRGSKLVEEYCSERNIPYNRCGKLIIANREDELPVLQNLFENAKANNIEGIEIIDQKRVNEIQPGCTEALQAIWSPNTAIVDWRQIALSYADDFQAQGGQIIKNFTVYRFESDDNTILMQDAKTDNFIETKSVINCAGMFSDYFARQTGNNPNLRNVPFKGSYFLLDDRKAQSIRTNIYPVPNQKVPFLGIHITPRLDGSVLIGPTAVLSIGYESYDGYQTSLVQVWNIFIRSGLFRMLRNKDYLEAGLLEIFRSYSKRSIARDVARFIPDIEAKDLIYTDFCGLRAQAISREGKLVDDFILEMGLNPQYNRVIHLRNCPSPAATSSLAIAEHVINLAENRFL